jgi:hypothetical protein
MRNVIRVQHSDIKPWVAKAIEQESYKSEDQLWRNAPTAEQAKIQLLQRVRFLRKHAKNAPQAGVVAERLERCNSEKRCLSGACPVCGRLFQRWFVRATKPFIRKHLKTENRNFLAVSLIPPSPRIKPRELSQFSITDLHRRLKYAMDKADIGSAIGGIDFSFNEDQEAKFNPFWNVHLYAITAGEKEQLSRQLKAIVQYSRAVPRPKRVTSFENKAIRRSYALKMHFERRIGYDEIKSRNGKRRECRNTKRDRLLAAQRLELYLFLDRIGFAERAFFRGAKPVQDSHGVSITLIAKA